MNLLRKIFTVQTFLLIGVALLVYQNFELRGQIEDLGKELDYQLSPVRSKLSDVQDKMESLESEAQDAADYAKEAAEYAEDARDYSFGYNCNYCP